jgi:uncharacterized protein YcaQ
MTESGALLPVKVEHLPAVYFVRSDHLQQLQTASADAATPAAAVCLLSPFDNLIIQRKRLQQLFGFDYQIECYVPAAKRTYGYFCVPILWGERFVGRLDPKAHRAAGRFELRALYLDSELQHNTDFLQALTQALKTFAAFNNCSSVALPDHVRVMSD